MKPLAQILLALIPLVLTSTSFAENTWYVDVGGTAPGTGTIDDPYTSLQYAISRSTTLSNDTVLVAPGTYYEVIDYLGKSLIVQSAQGSDSTILDAGGADSVVSFVHGEGAGTTLAGFTLRNGQAFSSLGGGILCRGANVQVDHCILRDNQASKGGGVYCSSSSLSLVACTIEDNMVFNQGGGLYALNSTLDLHACEVDTNHVSPLGAGCGLYLNQSTTTISASGIRSNSTISLASGAGIEAVGGALSIRDSTIEDNRLGEGLGGGLNLYNVHATIVSCVIRGNHAFTGNTNANGGGMNVGGGTLAVSETLFADNLAAFGGGIDLDSATASFVSCSFFDNLAQEGRANSKGGGIYSNNSTVTADRCIFAGNRATGSGQLPFSSRGGAVYGPAALTRCSIVRNQAASGGGGVWDASLSSCISWNNAPAALGGAASAIYSDVQGGALGAGNFDMNPLFWNASGRDYHLLAGSPCIDTGNPGQPLDPDGSIADVGAFTFESDYSRTPTAFCFGDGTGNACPCANSGASGHGCENSFATGGGLLTASGTSSVEDDTIRLHASGLPLTAPCFFFQGESQRNNGLGAPFGDGLVCVGGPAVRLGEHSAQAGIAEFGFGVAGDPSITHRSWIPPIGATRYYQAWYRNAALFCTPAGFNYTNGLRVIWTP